MEVHSYPIYRRMKVLLAASSSILLLLFFLLDGASWPDIQSEYSTESPTAHFQVTEFMNNTFRGKNFWHFPRLSYQNTLSITTFYFPSFTSQTTNVIDLHFWFKHVRLNPHKVDSIFMKSVGYVEVLDVYVNVGQFFYHGSKLYFDKCICMSATKLFCPDKFTAVTASFDLVVGFQHGHSPYGHFVFDQFVYLLILPPNIVQDAIFLYNGYHSFLPLFFGIIGVPPSHVINANLSQIYHVQRYYYFSPTPCHSENALLNQMLSKLLRKSCSVPEDGAEKPWRFVFYNRETPQRKIDNDLEHIECFQAMAPNGITFQIVGDFMTQNETALFYYEVEIMFSIHGSIFPVIMFMQHGAVYVERHLSVFYSSACSLAYSLGVHSVFIFSEEADRWKPNIEIKVSISGYIMKSALEMVKNPYRR